MAPFPEIHAHPGCIAKLAEITAHRSAVVLYYYHASAQLMSSVRKHISGNLLSSFRCPAGLLTIEIAQAMQRGLWKGISDEIPMLIAIGGGSTIDLAKAMRFDFPQHIPLQNLLDQPIQRGAYASCPLIAVPTTAGTGSEVSPTSTIWNPYLGKKHSLYGPAVMPDIALVDADLCLGTPWEITRDSAIDALSHALESIWNVHSTPATDRLAIAAAQAIVRDLPLARQHPTDIAVRASLSQAALDAGQAMAVTQTAIVHALSYDDTLQSGLSHGHACARWLAAALQLAKSYRSDLIPKLDEALGKTLSQPMALHEWLHTLGFTHCVPPHPSQDDMAKIQAALHSTRGKNFIQSQQHEIESI